MVVWRPFPRPPLLTSHRATVTGEVRPVGTLFPERDGGRRWEESTPAVTSRPLEILGYGSKESPELWGCISYSDWNANPLGSGSSFPGAAVNNHTDLVA